MTIRRGRALVAVAVAILATGMTTGAAAKKKKVKNVFTATVDGKTVKLPTNVSFTAGGPTIAFMALGQKRKGKLLKTISVACGDFPPATIPGSSMFCTAQYQEFKTGRHPVFKSWFEPAANLSVSFQSYDGTHVEGSFDYPSLPSAGADPPVALTGHFSGTIRSGS